MPLFDYTNNWYYFVTVCTKKRIKHFGHIEDGKMILNELWIIAEKVRLELPMHYKNCILDEYCFMPDHFHWIIIIEKKINIFRYDFQNEKIHWLSEIIRGFKTYSSKEINQHLKHNGFAWQRSFHDYVIKTEAKLQESRNYIISNPRNSVSSS